jgi:hypothetical protein
MEMTELKEIPSEFIEPYIVDYISKSLKALAEGRDFDDVDDFRSKMHGFYRFIQHSCGIHARLASDNIILGKIINAPNENIMAVVKEIYGKTE